MNTSNDKPFDYHEYFSQIHSLGQLPIVRETFKSFQALNDRVKQAVSEGFKQLHKQLQSLPINDSIRKLNDLGSNIERGFNIAAVVPVLGTLTSLMAFSLAKIQFLAGGIFAAVAESTHFIAAQVGADKELLASLRKLSTLGLEFMIHGVLNIIRRAGEILVGTCTLGLGSVFLTIPNMTNNRYFAPFFAYGTLTNEYLSKEPAPAVEKQSPEVPSQAEVPGAIEATIDLELQSSPNPNSVN